MGTPHQPEKCEAVFGSADAHRVDGVAKARVILGAQRMRRVKKRKDTGRRVTDPNFLEPVTRRPMCGDF
jgi:hypothetical protein